MMAVVKLSVEVALFWTTPVTFVPMTELMRAEPVPLPELVIVPVLLTAAVVSATPLTSVLSLSSMRLPVPIPTPPVKVSALPPAVLLSVVPAALAVRAALTVRAEVVLFWMMPVTLVPTPALMLVVPVPALEPELVMVQIG